MWKPHFASLAAYNRWANRRLCDAVAGLPDAVWREDRGAFFGSLRGTLNHLLVADRVWLRRIEGSGPQPSALDEILFDRFDAFRPAREAEDERIIRMVEAADEARLASTLSYRTMAGAPFEQPLTLVLTHVFNHQTHHRGQAHTLLTQSGCDAPPLDYLFFVRET